MPTRARRSLSTSFSQAPFQAAVSHECPRSINCSAIYPTTRLVPAFSLLGRVHSSASYKDLRDILSILYCVIGVPVARHSGRPLILSAPQLMHKASVDASNPKISAYCLEVLPYVASLISRTPGSPRVCLYASLFSLTEFLPISLFFVLSLIFATLHLSLALFIYTQLRHTLLITSYSFPSVSINAPSIASQRNLPHPFAPSFISVPVSLFFYVSLSGPLCHTLV